MSEQMRGVVNQYGSKGFGFIQGEDGLKYFFHKQDIIGGGRLNIKSKVSFDVSESEKGWVAKDINLLSGHNANRHHKKDDILPANFIKALFSIMFIIQIFTLYLVLD